MAVLPGPCAQDPAGGPIFSASRARRCRWPRLWPLSQVFLVLTVAVVLCMTIASQTVAAVVQDPASASNPVAAPGDRRPLSDSDCGKCHRWQTWVLSTRGGKHQALLSCTDCHAHHPPSTWEVIPECGMCHAGEPHFAIEGCLTCHADPHAPMDLVLNWKITEPCLSCHPAQGKQLQDFPSFHSNIACTFCHSSHGFVPECVECHKPHIQGAAPESCVLCHQAHKPLVVEYGDGDDEALAAACGGCHAEVAAQLQQSQSKHSTLSCSICHVQRHKMVPACGACHGTPHPDAMMARFSGCAMCHNTAHDLHR